ncbi:MAG: hypothetical protein ACKVTZ_13075, partial [Bacteroidia bacterium]
MKKNILFSFVFFCLQGLWAQNGNVGIGTTLPHPKAKLEVFSTDQGVLIPKMPRANMGVMTAADEGILIYDSNDHRFFVWDGTAWQPFPDFDWIV